MFSAFGRSNDAIRHRPTRKFRITPYPTYRCRATARVNHCEVAVILIPAESAPSSSASAAVGGLLRRWGTEVKKLGSAPQTLPVPRFAGHEQRRNIPETTVTPGVPAGPSRSGEGSSSDGAAACAVSDSESELPPPLLADGGLVAALLDWSIQISGIGSDLVFRV